MAWFSMAVQPSFPAPLLINALRVHPHMCKKNPCDQIGRPLRKDQYLHIYYGYTQCYTCFIKISIWLICKVNTVTVLENSFILKLKLNAASMIPPPRLHLYKSTELDRVRKSKMGPCKFREGGVLCGKKHATDTTPHFQGKSLGRNAWSSCFFIFKGRLLFHPDTYWGPLVFTHQLRLSIARIKNIWRNTWDCLKVPCFPKAASFQTVSNPFQTNLPVGKAEDGNS